MAKLEAASPLESRLLLYRKRKHVESEGQGRWQAEVERQIYSSRLVSALRRLRRRKESDAVGSHVVRDAADRVLAASARGETRWSRAILRRRRRSRADANETRKKAAGIPLASASIHRISAARMRSPFSPLQSKINALSRLVPGCRKISVPGLIAETTDYIAALEMQVKAMASLMSVLSGGA